MINKKEPKEAYFLVYNKDEIWKSLIASEGHFRNLQDGAEKGFLQCIVKHLADGESHADEAISHSLSLGDKKTHLWVELRDKIREFRKQIQQKNIDMMQGIKKIREIRRQFESFNPDYDVSQCKSCGVIDEKFKDELKELAGHDFNGSEVENAQKILDELSKKYDVDPPELEIKDDCSDPSYGLYENKKISLCKGGVSQHVLAHEFSHYLQQIDNKPLNEDEAEEFALEHTHDNVDSVFHSEHNRQKDLYSLKTYNICSEHNMKLKPRGSIKTVALIYGADQVGVAINQGLKQLDTMYPDGIAGQKISLIGDIAGTVGGVLAGLYMKAPYNMIGLLIGGYMSTDLWRQAGLIQAGLGGQRVVYTPVNGVVRSSVQSSYIPTGTSGQGKYMVTG